MQATTRPARRIPWPQFGAHALALVPLAQLPFQLNGAINPVQELTIRTGTMALLLLVLSLAATPLNALFGWRWALPLRKMLGLYAFFYASLHALTFFVVDYGLDLALIWADVGEKRYIYAGSAAFLLLLPLALTSTRAAMRRLGKNWKRLHRLVYVAAPLAVVHYLWAVKSDIRLPLLYAAVLALLLALRLPALKRRLRRNQH
jgi:sulfoxide reductase heme-binding subunit YedZ